MIVFKGSGGVRSGWRFAGFLVLALGVIFLLSSYFEPFAAKLLHIDDSTINAPVILLNELGLYFIAVLIATSVAARLEHRRIDSYGLPIREAFGPKYWEGIVLGIVAAGAVAIGMLAFRGFVIFGFALHGSQWFVQPVLYALAMIFVGITEEYLFRGYLLQSLARGIGFWPAAVITTLLFGALHLTKNDENFIDIFNIMALGLLTCFMLRRTGSLWMAAGFHAAFDFMQFFVIGSSNGGQLPEGVLLNATFPGSAWVNGGQLGTEASWFMFPVMIALFGYVMWRYPKNRPLSTD
jgi:membrane protease YdiL (CAAX protease family)